MIIRKYEKRYLEKSLEVRRIREITMGIKPHYIVN